MSLSLLTYESRLHTLRFVRVWLLSFLPLRIPEQKYSIPLIPLPNLWIPATIDNINPQLENRFSRSNLSKCTVPVLSDLGFWISGSHNCSSHLLRSFLFFAATNDGPLNQFVLLIPATDRGVIRRIVFSLKIVPLIRRCNVSDSLNTVCNENMKSARIVVYVTYLIPLSNLSRSINGLSEDLIPFSEISLFSQIKRPLLILILKL